MHRPCSISTRRGVASGTATRMAERSSTSGRPPRRNDIGIASGLPVAARWSPSTPFRAATMASRSAWGSRPGPPWAASAGPSQPNSASTLPPTTRVTPRTDL